MRISLSALDFKTLISGGVVKKDSTEIILQDIGYSTIFKLVGKEIREDSIPVIKFPNRIEENYEIRKCRHCKEPLLRDTKTGLPKYCYLCTKLICNKKIFPTNLA